MDKLTTRKIGDIGESYAVDYLESKGYVTIKRNYKKRCGEIDIISKYENYIVFTEVKTRKVNSMTKPCEAVTKVKAQRIFQTAYMYMDENPTGLQPRFDVIEVILDTNKMELKSINHMENVLYQEGDYAVF